MQAAGGQFFAGAPLADQEDWALDRRHAGEAFLEIQKRFGLAEAFLVLGSGGR